jgi:hypothetical protein
LDNVKSVSLEELNAKIVPQKFEGESPFKGKENTKLWPNLADLVSML